MGGCEPLRLRHDMKKEWIRFDMFVLMACGRRLLENTCRRGAVRLVSGGQVPSNLYRASCLLSYGGDGIGPLHHGEFGKGLEGPAIIFRVTRSVPSLHRNSILTSCAIIGAFSPFRTSRITLPLLLMRRRSRCNITTHRGPCATTRRQLLICKR